MKRKILFYGDSNTYGYDPRGFFGGRYPEKEIWTSLVADSLGEDWTVINEGENGRRVPDEAGGYKLVQVFLRELSKDDVFAVMLGSNDLLITTSPDAQIPIQRMDRFLNWLTDREGLPHVLVLAPQHIGTADHPDPFFRRFYEESVKMNEGFGRLAGQYGFAFADTAKWKAEVAYDEIHFSKAGHRTFAENMIRLIREEEKKY